MTLAPELLIDFQFITIIPGNYRRNWNSNHGNEVGVRMQRANTCRIQSKMNMFQLVHQHALSFNCNLDTLGVNIKIFLFQNNLKLNS